MSTREQYHRLLKAIRLADALDALGYTDLNLEAIHRPHLIVAQRLANVNLASPATWDQVLALLKERRLVRDALAKV